MCIRDRYEALRSGALLKMARLEQEFLTELYRLADYLPVLGALRHTGADLYRLLRILEDARMWGYIVDCHARLVQALAVRDHDAAAAALNAEYDLFEPLLEECRYTYPGFFAQD